MLTHLSHDAMHDGDLGAKNYDDDIDLSIEYIPENRNVIEKRNSKGAVWFSLAAVNVVKLDDANVIAHTVH